MSPSRDQAADTGGMQDDVAALIRDLGDPSCEREETKFALIEAGPDVVPPMIKLLAGLDRFGKLTAIEVFEALNDRAPASALTDLLSDDDSTVREWAADLLGTWKYQPAASAVRTLHARLLVEEVPPDWTEPLAVRRALAAFGLRSVVTPQLTASLEITIAESHGWRPADLDRVLADLAAHDQFVLHLIAWRLGRGDGGYKAGNLYWVNHPPPVDWSYAPKREWKENVRTASSAALACASSLPEHVDLVMLDWISEADMSLAPDE
jgi:hypothetical protein